LRKVIFNNIDLTEQIPGLLINKIYRDILPPRAVNLIDVPARMGAYFLNVKNGVRTYKADITLIGSSFEDVRLKMRDLASILNTDKLVPLVFDDESYKTYMAIAIDNTDLAEKSMVAEGTITFLIPDPVGKGATVPSNLGAAGAVHSLTNNANSPAFPIFKVDFTADAQHFALIGPDGFVLLGNPAGVDDTVKDPEEISLFDPCDDLTPWATTGIQLDYADAAVAGTMAVVPDAADGGFKFEPSAYGDDATYAGKWHGPGIKRSLPVTLQDFNIEIALECISTVAGTGRVEIILFDASNVSLGKLVVWDRFEISELTTGHIYAGSNGSNERLVWSVGPKQFDWNNFFGKVFLQRVGNVWSAFCTQTDSFGRYKYDKYIYGEKIIDGAYTNPVASIQIHVSKYDNSPAADMSIRDIKVRKINTVLVEEVPTIFKAGDQLVIDHEKGACFLNGKYFNKYLDPGSRFFKIKPGSIQVTSSTDAANTTINADITERWL
jgi:predicted phage tail component-like protein